MKRNGFTLMELMIVLAIIGILTAIALPSYSRYTLKANRVGAESLLMDIAQKEQQYLFDNRSYLQITDCAGLTTNLGISVDDKVASNYTCKVDVTAGPPPTFIATATPKSGTRQAKDGVTLTINQAGAKTPSDKW